MKHGKGFCYEEKGFLAFSSMDVKGEGAWKTHYQSGIITNFSVVPSSYTNLSYELRRGMSEPRLSDRRPRT